MLKATFSAGNVLWAVLIGWALWLTGGAVSAATLTVGNPSDSGVGSLRQAIADAMEGDTINVPSVGTIILSSGALVIDKSLSIVGTGAVPLTISGNNATRIFQVTSGTVVLAGFTLTSGLAEAGSAGGAIRNSATLTLNNCTVTNSRAETGGGICNDADALLTLNNSFVDGNAAIGANGANGGGIVNSGILTVNSSTFYRNHTVSGEGAGIYQAQGGLLVNNSTFYGNSASFACAGRGGALAVEGGTAEVNNSTIAGNSASASFGGGGIFQGAGTLSLNNTILAGNSAPDGGADCSGTITTGDFNLVQDTSGCTLAGTHNVIGQDPLLGQVQNNGGLTFTMALLSGSPALDSGKSAGTPPTATDQRGAPRPVNSPAVISGDGSDIGAFEANDPAQTGLLLVNTLSDHDDGVCGATDCTLREAIHTANNRAGDDAIGFIAGLAGTIGLEQALPALMSNIVLTGPAAPGIIVERSQVPNTPDFSIFVVSESAIVTISALTLQHGRSEAGGGIVVNAAAGLTLSGCTLIDNEATAGDGGGVLNLGALALVNCTLARNIAPNGKGGGVASNGTLSLAHCTLTGNSAGSGGGLDIAPATSATINGSLFAGNSAPLAADCQGAFTTGDYNLVQDPSGCVLSGANNITGQDPLLGPLQDNGGPTPTCALQSGSPALDTGGQAGGLSAPTDQRGFVRPADNPSLPNPPGGDGSDIGALEADVTQGNGVIVVNTTDDLDDGACTVRHCSLREAINAANAAPNAALPDEIRFAIPGTGPRVIAPLTAFPTISEAVILDGTTQAGYAGLPIIEIRGTSAGAGVGGLTINAAGCRVKGLSITRFAANGITLLAGQNVVENCWIGIFAGSTSGGAAGNAGSGIFIDNVPSNTIGSVTAGLGNVISANNGDGILLRGSSAGNNLVIGNSVGLAVNGTLALGNGGNGIGLDGATQNTIGGQTGGEGNVIVGNRGNGIFLQGGATGNVIKGNKIGVAPNGAALGNIDDGVLLEGASANIIGDAASGAGNVIAGNGNHGVQITNGDGNTIRGNAIYSNTLLGIELGTDGVTINDALDADAGPNQAQNYPVITDVTTTNDQTTIGGTFNSQPNATYILDFYQGLVPDPSGNGEGDVFLQDAGGAGSPVVTTDANGFAAFSFTIAGNLGDQYVSATATDAAGNTSEFSGVINSPSVTVTDVTVTEGNAGVVRADFVVSLSVAGSRTISVNYASVNGTALAPGDYTATTGTLSFAPGQTSKTVSVSVNGNYVPESDETLFLNLSDAVNATLGDAQGIGTIANDDFDTTPPSVNFTTSATTPAGTTPLSNATLYNAIPTITGVAADAGSGVSKVELRLYRASAVAGVYEEWNGTVWTASARLSTVLSPAAGGANVSFSKSGGWPSGSNLSSGTYYLVAYAYDRAGKYGFFATIFKIVSDTTPPSVSFTTSATTPVGTTPLKNATLYEAIPTITGVAADAGSGVSKVELRLYRASAVAGVYEEWNGTVWTASARLSTVLSPTAGGANVSFSKSGGWPSGSNLSSGTYYLVAYAYDRVGKSAAVNTFFKVGNDTTAPSVSFTTPTTNPSGTTPLENSTVGAIPDITGVAADGGSGIARVDLRLYRATSTAGVYEEWNGTTWTASARLSTTMSPASGGASVSWNRSGVWPTGSNLANGTYYLVAYAYDRAGKSAYIATIFKVSSSNSATRSAPG